MTTAWPSTAGRITAGRPKRWPSAPLNCIAAKNATALTENAALYCSDDRSYCIDSWPSAKVMKNTVMLDSAPAASAPRPAATTGGAGRYMSIANGAIAVTRPSTTALRTRDDTTGAAHNLAARAGIAVRRVSIRGSPDRRA